MHKLWTNFIKYGLPVLSGVLLLVAVGYVTLHGQSNGIQKPPDQPPSNPYGRSVAGAGIVEPLSKNIEVAAPVPDVVEKVYVVVQDQVKKGDPLFTLETRPLDAQLKVKQAALASAQATLERLKNEPRPERVPVEQAGVDLAVAQLQEAKDRFTRGEALFQKQAITKEEYVQLRSEMYAAEAQLRSQEAELKLLQAGAWEYEILVAEADARQAQAAIDEVQAEIDQRTVRAPIDGTILQVELEPGEYVGTPPGEPVMIMGDVSILHVRVDIDEYDIPRFRKGAPAKAIPRGGGDVSYALSFVRVEPFVVPKRSLTGATTERVDTRVLQVIYAVEGSNAPIYVGQQVDVYIDVGSAPQDEPSPRQVSLSDPRP